MISAQGKTAHHPSKVRYIRNKGGWLKAGDLAYKLGSYAPAVEAYSHALAASPNDITVADGLIRALQKSGNSASARAYQRYRDWVFERKK